MHTSSIAQVTGASAHATRCGRNVMYKNRKLGCATLSHYYLRSLSRTSRTFYFSDPRGLLEVLGDFLGRVTSSVPSSHY